MTVRSGFVEKGSYLLVESLDRLSRESARKALRTLEDICDEGITVVTLLDNHDQEFTAERLDQDPAALFFSLVIFLRANEESLTKRNRQLSAWPSKIDRARKGEKVIITHAVPSWIKVVDEKFVVDEERVKPVKLIFKLAEMGLGAGAITTTLNKTGWRSLRGFDHWHRCTVQTILINAAVIGDYVPHTYEVIEGRRVRVAQESVKNYFPKVVPKKNLGQSSAFAQETAC